MRPRDLNHAAALPGTGRPRAGPGAAARRRTVAMTARIIPRAKTASESARAAARSDSADYH